MNKNNNTKQINLKKFTWDYPENTISEQKLLNSPELISRVLKYGNIYEWVWLIQQLKKEGIKNFLRQYSYKLDDRTLNWWRIYCEVDNTFQRTERPLGNIKKINPVR